MMDLYLTDPLLDKVSNGSCFEYILHDDFHFLGSCLCVPESSLCLCIICEFHVDGHVGRNCTLHLAATFSFWLMLRRDVECFME